MQCRYLFGLSLFHKLQRESSKALNLSNIGRYTCKKYFLNVTRSLSKTFLTLTDLASLCGVTQWVCSGLPTDSEKVNLSSPPCETYLALKAAPNAAEFCVSS